MIQTTVRTPSSRIRAIIPGGVGELVGVEVPGVVLRLPGRVDDDRVERQAVLAVALEVLEHVVAGARRRRGSSSARRPTRAAARACPVSRQEVAQPRRRGPGRRNRCSRSGPARRARETRRLAGEIELARRRRRVSSQTRPAGAREQPRHRRVVALRDAAVLEHVRAGSRGPCSGGRRRGGPCGRPGRRRARGGRRARSGARPSPAARRRRPAAGRPRSASSIDRVGLGATVDVDHGRRRARLDRSSAVGGQRAPLDRAPRAIRSSASTPSVSWMRWSRAASRRRPRARIRRRAARRRAGR